MIKKILFFPGFLVIAIIYFFPTEWGRGRNTIMGLRWWEYRDKLAPIISIAIYLTSVALAFSHQSSGIQPTNTAKQIEPEIASKQLTKIEQTIKDDKQINSQYGQLSIVGEVNEMQLMFDGKKLREGVGFSLSFVKQFNFTSKDIILVMNNSGGTACPAQYFFVTLNGATDIQLSPEFGTCSDLIETSQDGKNITVTMLETSEHQISYVYSNGVISENGTPLK